MLGEKISSCISSLGPCFLVCVVGLFFLLPMVKARMPSLDLHQIHAFGGDRPILSSFIVDTFKLSNGGHAVPDCFHGPRQRARLKAVAIGGICKGAFH